MNADIPHILVVDDDIRLRNLLSKFLSENGFLVSAASDAADARTKMKTLAFDLIVLDLMMPGESGLEFAEDLRRRRRSVSSGRRKAGRPCNYLSQNTFFFKGSCVFYHS